LGQVILDQRYACKEVITDEKTYLNDIDRFMALVDSDSSKGVIFSNYHIFKCADGSWNTACQVFLDAPYVKTDLSLYHSAIGDNAPRMALSEKYEKCGIELERIRKFAVGVGCQANLEVTKVSCEGNPKLCKLRNEVAKATHYTIDEDYTIQYLAEL
jgi:hypothetical protein